MRLPGLPRPAILAALTLGLVAGSAAPGSSQTSSGISDQGPVRVEGVVRGDFQGRRSLLPYAQVEAWSGVRHVQTVADSLGRYRLVGLAPGMVRLRVSHAGHADARLDVWVPGGSPAQVDVELRGRPIRLPSVAVVSTPLSPRTPGTAAASELARVEALALQGGSGVPAGGVAGAVAGLPGQDPARSTDVLLLRGSETSRTRVLLDGAPVFTPFHVAGLLPGFQPEALGGARLHMGGAPARFDGGLTYILDLQTRSPDEERIRGSGSLDLLSAQATLHGPLVGDLETGGVGILASARALHNAAAEPLGSSPYGYRDALVALTGTLAADQTLRATGFWNREAVRLDLPAATLPGEEAWWSNGAASASWSGRLGSAWGDITVAGGSYSASLPLQPTPTDDDPEPDPLLAEVESGRLRATADLAFPTEAGVLRAGVSGEQLESRYSARSTGGGSSHTTRSRGWTAGGYLDVTRHLGPEVSLRGGLRLDGFGETDERLRLAPRASLSWAFAPTAVLTFAAGRYHQHARTPDQGAEQSLAEVVDPVVEASAPLSVATSDHLVATLDQQLGTRTRLTLDAFWKGFHDLAGDEARLRSSGVDVRIHRSSESVEVWAGYGLAWFWNAEGGQDSERFSGRHLLSAGLDAPVAGPVGTRLRLAYGAGLPFTSVPFSASNDELASPGLESGGGGEDPSEPSPRAALPGFTGGVQDAFLRLDVEVHAELRPEVAGRRWTLQPYLRLLNALDRRDALFYAFQREGDPTALARRSLVPVLGISWRF